ncbi:hypothetical protein CLV63_10436 [Murinocardiopsis flavida]|uniref:Butirosin biosynthesis protein H-like n=1 Tax=Murinocardiopsis flavida TaxID=645275 RepID=A0A2P8DNL2_9ACTN|nr:hypothetical protein [Murinocardiopsis flavida]PSK98812.1 hypothetical protein CLV63_10436 [Murinocardiopsis flavida]
MTGTGGRASALNDGLGMPPYTGSGPYCYTHSLAMVLGPAAPAPAVIETLTGAPFGVQSIGGTLPLFDPYGWNPEVGLDAAIGLLGWRCERSAGGTAEEAPARLRAACVRGPALVGPVDMGLLAYQTGLPDDDPSGGDHYVVVLGVEDGTVLLHDPHGHPYATLPAAAFTASWRAAGVPYVEAGFVLRTGFVRERAVADAEALRRSLPNALDWLGGRTDRPMPPGSLGGAAAVEALASQVDAGLDPGVRALLAEFGVRVGARRLADAATCLGILGLAGPAAVATGQARILGGLQHPLVTGDDAALAAGLRRLAPTYERLRGALAAEVAERTGA